ncbi:hypothetical protein DESA109040_12980 [Deinococcus saxicola]|uniref:hypothetical protein n=1 Tax=Deinococcus saxicola TaxID=249406 RepID=UPI0039F0270F
MTIRPGPQRNNGQITESERHHLERLYRDGAWSRGRAIKHLGEARLDQLVASKHLIVLPTEMGVMVLLLALGRIAVFRTCDKPSSFGRQLDQAYLRIALQQLQWPLLTNQSLRKYDKTGRMQAVLSPFGPTLVSGIFNGGAGLTREGMEGIITRLNSSALFHNFYVVILTPGRRGQKLAARHYSWFHVVQCLPRGKDAGRLFRQQGVERDAGDPGRPDLAQRVQAAKEALLIDTVMSSRQLQRHFGLRPADMEGVSLVPVLVRPVHARPGLEVATVMYLSSKRMARLQDHALTHRAGVAEMRHQLGVPAIPGLWEVEARGKLRYEEPDAVWRADSGDVAIEYDLGSYTMKAVDQKVGTFIDRAFDRIVWGAASSRRAVRLAQTLGPQGVQVLNTQWWTKEV